MLDSYAERETETDGQLRKLASRNVAQEKKLAALEARYAVSYVHREQRAENFAQKKKLAALEARYVCLYMVDLSLYPLLPLFIHCLNAVIHCSSTAFALL
jgi:hypothetical protein